jgi:hypothetical protein
MVNNPPPAAPAGKPKKKKPAESPFMMRQGYEVLRPQTEEAYPILRHEWDSIKGKLKLISWSINIYMEIGILLLGAALSVFITILIGAIQTDITSQTIAWGCLIISLVVGLSLVTIGYLKENIKRTEVKDIITQMETIESRFGSSEMQNGEIIAQKVVPPPTP